MGEPLLNCIGLRGGQLACRGFNTVLSAGGPTQGGRSSEQAYAYLLVPSLERLSRDAQRRLRALMDYNELGGGFKRAMSDLQIRGGGNILGESQSGNIAAVGYDLYLDLLQKTVEDLKRKAAGNEAALIAVRDIEIDLSTRTIKRGKQCIELAPKEFDLLVELIRHDGAVVSRSDLMHAVWGHTAAIVSRTVDTHIAELRRKLADHSDPSPLIITVRKAGYRINTD